MRIAHAALMGVVEGCLAVTVACAGQADILSWNTMDGVQVGAVAGESGQHVILILDSAQCLSCFSPLSAWRTWGSDSGRSVILLLTRQPNDVERRKMRLAGIVEDGVLQPSKATGTPIQIFLSGDAQPRITYEVTDEDAFQLIAAIRIGQ